MYNLISRPSPLLLQIVALDARAAHAHPDTLPGQFIISTIAGPRGLQQTLSVAPHVQAGRLQR